MSSQKSSNAFRFSSSEFYALGRSDEADIQIGVRIFIIIIPALFSGKSEHILRITTTAEIDVDKQTATFLRYQVNHLASASETTAASSQIGQAVLLLLLDHTMWRLQAWELQQGRRKGNLKSLQKKKTKKICRHRAGQLAFWG